MSSHKNIPITQSQLLTGGNYYAVWHLRGTNSPYNLDMLPLDNGCIVDCANRIKLRFHLKYLQDREIVGKSCNWLSLCVTVDKTPKYPVWFYVLIHKLDQALTSTGYFNDNSQWKGIIVSSQDERESKVIFPHFINISTTLVDESGKSTSTYFSHDAQYMLLFQVEINPNQHGALEDEVASKGLVRAKPEISTLSRDILIMYNNKGDHFDLKLEMKNKDILNAHRFILAARSPVLRKRMERELTKESFRENLKMHDVTSSAMTAILHWMYTEELHKDIVSVLDEVIATSQAF